MKQLPHVSKRTAWDDVTAELEELRRETEMQRADLMALENARVLEGAEFERELTRERTLARAHRRAGARPQRAVEGPGAAGPGRDGAP